MDRDYRNIIKQCFEDRRLNNSRYSLRAFARDLSLTPGQLSLVLNRKKGLSHERALKVFSALQLDSALTKFCLLQIQAEHSRKALTRTKASQQLTLAAKEFDSLVLTKDATDVIADWRHFAILQLLTLKDSPTHKSAQLEYITSRLGIHTKDAEKAINRMLHLELITEKNNKWSIVHETVLTTNGAPSAALRQYHKQLINKALHSIETQSVDQRVLNSMILPIQKKSMQSIAKDISNFQRNMAKKYGRVREEDGESVYSLTLQFFELAGQVT